MDPVTQARLDSVRPYEPAPEPVGIPADLDLTPDRQVCETAADCVVVFGVPGQNFRNLCCATCASHVAVLSTRYGQRLVDYKAASGCAQAVCPPLGDCAIELVTAECSAGKCRRRPSP